MDPVFVRAGTPDALVLNCISKHAFESDIAFGAPSAGGPPGYMSLRFHMKMARSGHLFKCTDHGLTVGGAILYKNGDTLSISRIFVDPVHHRKGYGTYMMRAIEAMFPEVKQLVLDTPAWNSRTNSFYTKLGYQEIKRDRDLIRYALQHRHESGSSC